MKVVLVGINSKFVHSNLAIRYLEAFTRDLDYSCHLMEFSINDKPERVVEDIIAEKPSILGFSCYIWNIEFIRRVSTLIKLIDPKVEILYGGPEASFEANEFLKNHPGEYVIEGEGEETYREFIKMKLKAKEEQTKSNFYIKGLYFKQNNEIIYGGRRALMDLHKVAFPYKEDDNLKNKIVYYEASRGCPFNCKYCLSSTTHGVRFIDIDRVKSELKYFINKGVTLVKFVDRTFNCNIKFANEIWKFIVEQEGECSFHFEISADLLGEDSLEILSKAKKGAIQFEIGVQSTNIDVLESINRTIKFSNIKEKVEELNKIKNIKQHLDLIAGLPGENFESFKKSFNDVYSIHPDELQLGFLKLLKGSEMREEANKWGMVYSPYPPYEIIKTKDISYDELNTLKKIEHLVDKYNNSGKFINILKFLIEDGNFDTPFNFYLELSKFFELKGYFSRSISSSDYYEIFLNFGAFKGIKNPDMLKEVVKFDYLCFNKKKWLPELLQYKFDKNEEKEIKLYLKQNHIVEDINTITIHKFEYNLQDYLTKKIINMKPQFIVFFNNADDKYIFV